MHSQGEGAARPAKPGEPVERAQGRAESRGRGPSSGRGPPGTRLPAPPWGRCGRRAETPRPCEHSDGAPRGPAGDVAESPSLSPTRAGRARGRPSQARRASVHREPGSPGAVAGPPPPWATSRTVTDNGVAVPVDSAVAGGPGAGAAEGGCGLEVTSPCGSAGLGAASPPGTSPSPDPPACRVPGTEHRAAGGGRRRWACRRGSSGRAWRCVDTRPCFRNVQDLSFSSPLTLHISSKKSLPRGGGFSIWALWMSYFGGNLCVNSFPSPSSCGDN